ncbi:MAG: 50S ribosomal protein L24 [Fimbriimonadales bacterium]|nr:50S ribosomal protein L24 [Fimbriimonadales bacterium]
MVRKLERPLRMKIRTGDLVEVISGKDKGQRGRVQRVLPRENRVVVEGLNLVWKHQKPRMLNQKGNKIQMPAPLFASKVMLVCPHCDKKTRVGRIRGQDGKLYRVCKKCNEMIDATK